MATAAEMFGSGSRFTYHQDEKEAIVVLILPKENLTDPNLGGLDASQLIDGDKNLLASDSQLTVALLRLLYQNTSAQDKQDDPNYKVVATSVYPGRQQIGFEDSRTFDTYDFSFQVRQVSLSGSLPDPDNL